MSWLTLLCVGRLLKEEAGMGPVRCLPDQFEKRSRLLETS